MTPPELSEPPADEDAAPAAPPKRRGRTLLVLAALLAAGGAVVHFLLPRPAPPPAARVYTPAQAATAQQHINALRDQLLHPAAVAPENPSPETNAPATPSAKTRDAARVRPIPRLVRLQLSEADMNTYLASNPDARRTLQAHGVRAVQILLHAPRNMDVRAAVLYRGRPANIEVLGQLAASPDTICRFTATRAQVGRLPIPADTVTAQADKIAGLFAGRYRGRLPLVVQNVQVVGDSLVITGTPRPTGTH